MPDFDIINGQGMEREKWLTPFWLIWQVGQVRHNRTSQTSQTLPVSLLLTTFLLAP